MPGKMSDPGTTSEKIMTSGQALEKGPGRHQKKVRAGPGKGRIGESARKVESVQVTERWNPGEYWKR